MTKRPTVKGIDVFLPDAQQNIASEKTIDQKRNVKKEKIQTALWLPKELFKKLKLYAVKNEKTQSEVVAELIEKYCD